MALKGSFIKITSGTATGSQAIGLNGRNRTLPTGEEVAVSEAELELLDNSHATYDVVRPAKSSDLTLALDGPGDAPGTIEGDVASHEAGADYLDGSDPSAAGLTIRVSPETDDTPAGADHLTQTEPVDFAAAEDKARTEAQENLQAYEDGTQKPVVELTNVDPNQVGTDQGDATGDVGSTTLAVAPFDAGKTLEQPIKKITEDMDEFTRPQLSSLLKAEQAGDNRSTLIAAIEKKLGA